MIKKIKTNNAPQAIGAYSQGAVADTLVFTSGQIGINPDTGNLITDNFEDELKQVLNNVKSVLESGGSDIKNIIKLSVFITDLSNFKLVNDAFIDFFNGKYPARSVVEVSGLPLDANIEIEAIGKVI
jgi:2-iminobutanoate/2-iminopropanoate deaminase